jgi:hypothetical protein
LSFVIQFDLHFPYSRQRYECDNQLLGDVWSKYPDRLQGSGRDWLEETKVLETIVTGAGLWTMGVCRASSLRLQGTFKKLCLSGVSVVLLGVSVVDESLLIRLHLGRIAQRTGRLRARFDCSSRLITTRSFTREKITTEDSPNQSQQQHCSAKTRIWEILQRLLC